MPKKIEKPWVFEILFAATSKYAGKVLFVRKGRRLSFHYHHVKDEVLYVCNGKVHVEIEEMAKTKSHSRYVRAIASGLLLSPGIG